MQIVRAGIRLGLSRNSCLIDAEILRMPFPLPSQFPRREERRRVKRGGEREGAERERERAREKKGIQGG